MSQAKIVNGNTLILTVGFALLGFLGKELYREVIDTHDAVIVLKQQMVPRSEFELRMTEMKARLSSVEVEIEKIKESRKL